VNVEYNNIGDWSNVKPGQSGIIIDSPKTDITVGGDNDTVLKNLVLESKYDTTWGLDLAIDAKSSWIVTDTSKLASLTITKGAKIVAPPGGSLTMMVKGVKTDIKAGTYKNVVITLSGKNLL
jgi:hypothetical protein